MDDLARFIEKTTQPALTQRILAHLDECETCRVLLAASIRDGREEADSSVIGSFAPRTFHAGEVVGGRYQIVRMLSRGGMGEVYEASDLQLGGTIALKTIVCTGLDNASLYVRIRKEVQIARRVTDRNVCRILEFGLHQQSYRDQVEVIPFFTMELLSGETLAEYIARRGKVPVNELLPIVRQILRGLSAIHAAGIVHRDLKPENIFLLAEAGQLRVVVMDFGLARITDGRSSSSESSSASMVGTPTYMAPEQSLGGVPTVASDIFALGVILYRATAGELPFKGSTPVALAMARINGRAPRLSLVVPDVEPWFEQVVAKCLERVPAARYASVAELDCALVARECLHPRHRTRWHLIRAGAVVAVCALGAAAAFSWRYDRHVRTIEPGATSSGAVAPLNERSLRASLINGQPTHAIGSPLATPMASVEPERAANPVAAVPTATAVPVTPVHRKSNTRHAPLLENPEPIVETKHPIGQPPRELGEDEIVVPEFARQPQRIAAPGAP